MSDTREDVEALADELGSGRMTEEQFHREERAGAMLHSLLARVEAAESSALLWERLAGQNLAALAQERAAREDDAWKVRLDALGEALGAYARLQRGSAVGAGDGDTYVVCSVSYAQFRDALAARMPVPAPQTAQEGTEGPPATSPTGEGAQRASGGQIGEGEA